MQEVVVVLGMEEFVVVVVAMGPLFLLPVLLIIQNAEEVIIIPLLYLVVPLCLTMIVYPTHVSVILAMLFLEINAYQRTNYVGTNTE
jgi:hypothetical protein